MRPRRSRSPDPESEGREVSGDFIKATAFVSVAIFICGFRAAIEWTKWKTARDERRKYEATLPIR